MRNRNIQIIKIRVKIVAEDTKPNWDKIEELTNIIDKAVDEAILKQNMSFIEIDIAFLMVKEKLTQEKHRILNIFYKDEEIGRAHV